MTDAEPETATGASLTERTAPETAGTSAVRRWAEQVGGIAHREYRLVVRSRWTVGVALLFGVFTAAIVQLSVSQVGPGRFDAAIATIAELGVYLVPLVALAFGYDAVVSAHERGSLELLLSLPIPQRRVVLGKYLGRAGALAGAMLVGFVPGGVLLRVYLGGQGFATYAAVALTAVLAGAAFLALALLVSTVAREKVHALGVSLAAWLWFVLLHDIVALALVAALDLAGTAIAAMVLLNPVDCFRVLALSTVDVTAGGFGAIMHAANLSLPLVVAGLVLWTVVPLGVAMTAIRRRRV